MQRPRFRPPGLQSPWYHTPAPSGTVHSRPQRKCSQHTSEGVNPGTAFIAGQSGHLEGRRGSWWPPAKWTETPSVSPCSKDMTS